MSNPNQIDAIESADLANVSGGGLIGNAWKVAKGGAHLAKAAYKEVKPVVTKVAPFAIAAHQVNSIYNRAKHDLGGK